jgi:hypothetical protein
MSDVLLSMNLEIHEARRAGGSLDRRYSSGHEIPSGDFRELFNLAGLPGRILT